MPKSRSSQLWQEKKAEVVTAYANGSAGTKAKAGLTARQAKNAVAAVKKTLVGLTRTAVRPWLSANLRVQRLLQGEKLAPVA